MNQSSSKAVFFFTYKINFRILIYYKRNTYKKLLSCWLIRSSVVTTWEIALRWCTNPPVLLAPVSHHLAVNGARNAIMQFRVQFRQHIRYKLKYNHKSRCGPKQMKLTRVDGRLSNVSNGSGLHNVADDEFFDRLVFGNATSAIGATDRFHVSTTVFRTTSVASFASLRKKTLEAM